MSANLFEYFLEVTVESYRNIGQGVSELAYTQVSLPSTFVAPRHTVNHSVLVIARRTFRRSPAVTLHELRVAGDAGAVASVPARPFAILALPNKAVGVISLSRFACHSENLTFCVPC